MSSDDPITITPRDPACQAAARAIEDGLAEMIRGCGIPQHIIEQAAEAEGVTYAETAQAVRSTMAMHRRAMGE